MYWAENHTLIIGRFPEKVFLPSAAVLALFVKSMDIILTAALCRVFYAVVVQLFLDITQFFSKPHGDPE